MKGDNALVYFEVVSSCNRFSNVQSGFNQIHNKKKLGIVISAMHA